MDTDMSSSAATSTESFQAYSVTCDKTEKFLNSLTKPLPQRMPQNPPQIPPPRLTIPPPLPVARFANERYAITVDEAEKAVAGHAAYSSRIKRPSRVGFGCAKTYRALSDPLRRVHTHYWARKPKKEKKSSP